MLNDTYGRTMTKLRLSVTDECNYRCIFCMPANPKFFKKEELLTVPEIDRLVKLFSSMGVDEVKLTGGEPLARNDLPSIIEAVHAHVKAISMTTNGYYLARRLPELQKSGLSRLNVSVHSLNENKYRKITGGGNLKVAMDGINTAIDLGMVPLKVNMTVMRGFNDDEILDFVDFGLKRGIIVRFLEYEPFNGREAWASSEFVSAKEILDKISAKYRLTHSLRELHSTSTYYDVNGSGKIGIIPSVSAPFCQDCNRLRVTADGKLVPCMYSHFEVDLKKPLESGLDDDKIKEIIKGAVNGKFRGVIEYIEKNDLPSYIRSMYKLGG
ncbi:MAG: GTP 3',8-cyclase MoaA [Nitrososphaerota archaeon]|nr:GTP 3',8-cyclase MoaA [Nitrososphaerota archaeon]MDG6932295.1 GTP 3',8-cyclase MoaA [Nitrososphaerota archaeon]MDG6936471.1 GTP 3',8-cyclase MoaA [Nitrososphaerota archaeon]MDG6944663.1 GTP 3',8-cyclase MoaA [Nitrososphaerota archaeon]